MLFLYRCLIGLVGLILWPFGRFHAWRGERSWQDRLVLRRLPRCDIWLHAASVGEVRLVVTLCGHLKQEFPDLALQVSTMTATGYAAAKAALPDVEVAFFPLDLRRLMRRRLRDLQPKLLVLAEVEIWPNLLHEARRAGVRVILVNARLKERSFVRFRRFPGTTARLLAHYDRLFARSVEDRNRYLSLGAPEDRVTLAGDLKFDAPMLLPDPERIRLVRSSLSAGSNGFVFVCGSTRPDEEQQLSAALLALARGDSRFRLVLAPRHIERAGEVEKILVEAGFDVHRYQPPASAEPAPGSPSAAAGLAQDNPHAADRPLAILVDRLGVLQELFAASDLSFVGGTLTNTGGHNVLEPVWQGRPVVFGPDTLNIPDAAAYILANNFGTQIQSAHELVPLIEDLRKGRVSFAIRAPQPNKHSAVSLVADYVRSLISLGSHQ